MDFKIISRKGQYTVSTEIKHLVVLCFSRKDTAKTMEYIHMLEEAGVTCPKDVPVLYPCDPQIVTRKDTIDVIGGKTSGEAEYLILCHGGKFYIGLGSDHTDRELEVTSIHKSKQVCLKPCSDAFWEYDEVKDHLPELRIISSQQTEGDIQAYQYGTAGDILPFDTIVEKVQAEVPLEDCLIYTGTVPLLHGFVFGDRFTACLMDDVLGRELTLSYSVHVMEER